MKPISPTLRRPSHGFLSLLHAAVSLAMLVAGCHTPPPPTRTAEAHGISLGHMHADDQGGTEDRGGDYRFEAGPVRVRVGGLGRGAAARGAITEIRAKGVRVPLRIEPRVYVDGRGYPVVIERMRSLVRDGVPRLRMEGAVLRAEPLHVTLEVALAPGGRWLTLSARLEAPSGGPPSGARVGAMVVSGSGKAFLSGAQSIDETAWRRGSWFGLATGKARLALAFARGDVEVRGRGPEVHGPSLWEVVRAGALEGQETYAAGRLRIALLGDRFEEAVRLLGFARGRPYEQVAVHVPYRPEGATVHVEDASGRPLLVAAVGPDGALLLPLTPPADAPLPLSVRATAYGHAPSDPVQASGGARVRLVIPRGAALRVTVRDAEGHALAARARILRMDGGEPLVLGPDWQAAGAGEAVATLDGDATVPVPPGDYRVLVSHGPEWTLHEQRVRVTDTWQGRVRAELRHVVDPGPWIGCDFHVHAAPSYDSDVSLADRVTTLAAEGVRFAVATDHNHVTSYAPAVEALRVDDLATLAGVEVTTAKPEFGHFNAYPFPRSDEGRGHGAPEHRGTTPGALFRALRAASDGVVVQVNHPRLEPNIGYFDHVRLDPATGRALRAYSDDYDVLEVFNGYDIARQAYVERVFHEWLQLLARGKRVVGNGSSDSHVVRFQWAGYPRTYVKVPGGDPGDGWPVIRALKEGRAFVTSGPFLEVSIGEAGLGDTARAEDGRVTVRVRVRAAPWLLATRADLYVGSEIAESVPIPVSDERPVVRLDREVVLPVPHDTFVVVRVTTEQAHDDFFGREDVFPEAFTNPIWIDADGDGEVRIGH